MIKRLLFLFQDVIAVEIRNKIRCCCFALLDVAAGEAELGGEVDDFIVFKRG